MHTSRIAYIDRGAGAGNPPAPVGQESVSSASFCAKPPYKDKTGATRVNALDKPCITYITGIKDPSHRMTPDDALKIGRWLESSSESDYWKRRKSTVQTSAFGGAQIYGPLRSAWDQFIAGKTFGEISERLQTTDNRDLSYQADAAGAPGIGDLFDGIANAFRFITDPAMWLAIIAMLLGFLILIFAFWKGLA